MANLTKAKYSGMDFATYVDDIRSDIQANYAQDFNDFALSGVGQMLIDIVAAALDNLSFYVDRRASDSYLATAATRTAVSRLTRQIGYKMRGAVPSSIDLLVSVKNPVAYDVTVPKGFKFKGPNSLNFEVASSVTFSPAEQALQTTKNIVCFEGQSLTESFSSDGSKNQKFELRKVPDGMWASSGSVVVKVDGVEYSESEFMTFDATQQFEADYVSSPTTIRFGDGVAGAVPASGASIEVSYLATTGQGGQVSKGTITGVVSPLVVNFQNTPLMVSSPTGSSGGADAESIEEARANAPQVFQSRLVAVTRKDYEALAQSFADPSFGRVSVAQAFSTRSAAQDMVVNSELNSIKASGDDPKAAVDAQVPLVNTALDAVDAAQVTLLAANDSVGVETTAVDAQNNLVQTSARTIRSKATEVSADLAGVSSDAGSVKATIQSNSLVIQTESQGTQSTLNGITTVGPDQLTVATKDALLAHMTQIDSSRLAIDNSTDNLDNILARINPDRKSTRLNSSHTDISRMPSSA